MADNNVIKMADDVNNTGFSSMFEKPRSRIIEDYFSNTPNEEVKFVNGAANSNNNSNVEFPSIGEFTKQKPKPKQNIMPWRCVECHTPLKVLEMKDHDSQWKCDDS